MEYVNELPQSDLGSLDDFHSFLIEQFNRQMFARRTKWIEQQYSDKRID